MGLLKTINYKSNFWLIGKHDTFSMALSVGSPFPPFTTTETVSAVFILSALPKTTSIILPFMFMNLLNQSSSIMVMCESANGGGVGGGVVINDEAVGATEIRITFKSIGTNSEDGGTRVNLFADIEFWN